MTPYDRVIDAIDKALDALDSEALARSREKSLVKTKLEEALLWAGMLPERPQPRT